MINIERAQKVLLRYLKGAATLNSETGSINYLGVEIYIVEDGSIYAISPHHGMLLIGTFDQLENALHFTIDLWKLV